MIHLTVQDLVQDLVQVFHLPPQAGVGQGADQGHVLKGIVLGDTDDTQDLIPGVAQDHTITDTGKGATLDTTEDIVAHLQDIDHGADILLDHTIEGLIPEVDQEAEDTMGLDEPYVLKLIEA